MIARLTRRHLVVFFRDPAAVFFSLLSALILFVLYTAFLGNLQTSSLAEAIPGAASSDIDAFVHAWTMAGIVMITTMTTSLSALSVFVNDRVSNTFRDFLISPVTRVQLISSYLLSAFVVSALMSLAVLALSQVYLGLVDGAALGPGPLGIVVAQVFGFCLLFSAIWSFVVTFIRSASVFMSVGTIVGTAGGFLAGAYITVGALPEGVVTFMNVLPLNPAATLMRGPFTEATLDRLADGNQATLDSLRDEYGLVPYLATSEVDPGLVWAIFAGLIAVFLALGIARIGRRIS